MKAATFGAAAVAVLAVVSSGGSAMAAPLVPANSVGFQLNASGTGLLIDLFGNELTGAQTSASVSYVTGASGAPTESSNASGEGVFLTSGGVDGKSTASAASGGTTTQGSTTDSCKQGSGGPQPPGSPITVALGLGCSAAQATVDPSSDGPQAYADSKVVDLQVDLSSLLHQLASGGATQLCSGLSQIPTLGSQILGPACNQVLSSISPSVEVTLGSALSQITTSPTDLLAQSKSSSIDVKLFPITINGSNEPLLEVTIPSAIATTEYTASGGWANNYDTTLIRISGTIIDDLKTASGGSFPDPLEIPPNNSGTSQLSAINSSPLGQLLTIDLASGSTSGNSVTGEGLKVTLLSGVPGVPGGGIVIDTSGVSTTETAAAGTSTAAGGVTTTTAAPAGGPGAAPTFAAASSPTAVHTGEWWSGSLPLLALLAAMGGALLGWPRIRRLPIVARLVARGSR